MHARRGLQACTGIAAKRAAAVDAHCCASLPTCPSCRAAPWAPSPANSGSRAGFRRTRRQQEVAMTPTGAQPGEPCEAHHSAGQSCPQKLHMRRAEVACTAAEWPAVLSRPAGHCALPSIVPHAGAATSSRTGGLRLLSLKHSSSSEMRQARFTYPRVCCEGVQAGAVDGHLVGGLGGQDGHLWFVGGAAAACRTCKAAAAEGLRTVLSMHASASIGCTPGAAVTHTPHATTCLGSNCTKAELLQNTHSPATGNR